MIPLAEGYVTLTYAHVAGIVVVALLAGATLALYGGQWLAYLERRQERINGWQTEVELDTPAGRKRFHLIRSTTNGDRMEVKLRNNLPEWRSHITHPDTPPGEQR